MCLFQKTKIKYWIDFVFQQSGKLVKAELAYDKCFKLVFEYELTDDEIAIDANFSFFWHVQVFTHSIFLNSVFKFSQKKWWVSFNYGFYILLTSINKIEKAKKYNCCWKYFDVLWNDYEWLRITAEKTFKPLVSWYVSKIYDWVSNAT